MKAQISKVKAFATEIAIVSFLVLTFVVTQLI